MKKRIGTWKSDDLEAQGQASPNSTSASASASASNEDKMAREAIAGSQKGLSGLLTWVRARAIRHALTRTQDPDEAEDIAQEVMIRVLRSIHTYRSQSRFSSWVYRITENQVLDCLRSRNSAQMAEKKALLTERPPNLAHYAAASVDAQRLWDAVNTVVDGLPKLQGRAFRLVVLQGLRPCEAAHALGKSQTNVRASLSRARVKIRERLVDRAPALVRDLGYLEPHKAA